MSQRLFPSCCWVVCCLIDMSICLPLQLLLESELFAVLTVSGTTASLDMDVGVPVSVIARMEMIWVR